MSVGIERHVAEVRRMADQLEDPDYRPGPRKMSEIIRDLLALLSATRACFRKSEPTDHDVEEVRYLTRMVGAVARRYGA